MGPSNRSSLSYISHAVKILMAAIIFVAVLLLAAISILINPDLLDNLAATKASDQEIVSLPYDESDGLLADDPNLAIIKANCTACHSARLVVQYRASREGWESVIRWMQRTQKLWDLGSNEAIILDYLAKNYAPESSGRRPPLKDIEWYPLD